MARKQSHILGLQQLRLCSIFKDSLGTELSWKKKEPTGPYAKLKTYLGTCRSEEVPSSSFLGRLMLINKARIK